MQNLRTSVHDAIYLPPQAEIAVDWFLTDITKHKNSSAVVLNVRLN